MANTINDKILDKIKEMTDNKNEFLMCKRILEQENLFQNDDEWDYRDQFKTYLHEYFPFQD